MSGSSPSSWWQARAVALAAAAAGGRAAAQHFRRAGLVVEYKGDESPVTRADREAEAACREVIRAAFPQDGWIGEETGEEPSTSGRSWIVDPIDGTRNFVRGIPLWSTLVACEERSGGTAQVVAAAAALPALGEIYDAVRGGGSRCNDLAVHVSRIAALKDALFCYEAPLWFERYGLAETFQGLCAATALQRGGGDAFFHLLVASGRAELVVEPSLSVWDIAATSLIVEEAGGRFSTLDGRADLRAGEAVLSNGLVHEQGLALIRSTSRPPPA